VILTSAPVATVAAVAALLTAVVGLYVSVLAYRGYRRNDSDAMRLLAVGVFCIAVAPFGVGYAAAPLLALSDAQVILGVTLSHTAGLVAIYRSLG
jgi:hypothetical protein